MNRFDKILDLCYCNDNYLIKNYNSKSNICYVFFSSLSLYPSRDEFALKEVCDNNRYEWDKIASNDKIIKNSSRIIFLRDLHKVFYQKGINAELNSIEKMADFINDNTEGFDVYLIGSSAGGYAALLFSSLIKNVKRVYSFGGILNLALHSSYYESTFFGDFDKKYSNISSMISKSALIYHFYGSQSQYDLNEIAEIDKKSFNNIVFIPLKSKKHAPRPSGRDLVKILTCSDNHLIKISNKIKTKKEITYNYFSYINIGFFKMIIEGYRNKKYKKS